MIFRILAVVSLLCWAASTAADEPTGRSPDFRIVGYLPDYRAAEFDPDSARGLTDLIVFSAEPTQEGGLNLHRLRSTPWPKLHEFKSAQRVRLILCVGGWGRSTHFAAVADSQELRHRFVEEAVRVCLEKRLDGLDLDWEHPTDQNQEKDYGKLLQTLREGFRQHGLSLSVTMAAWQRLPREAWASVDAVQIMSYDRNGQHSTFEAAQADVTTMAKQGAPNNKIVLGLPFYGRHVSKKGVTLTYRQIVARYKPTSETDEVESVYFNGPKTIRRKTQYAIESGLGGVMVWELGQDAEGSHSLLRTICEAVQMTRK